MIELVEAMCEYHEEDLNELEQFAVFGDCNLIISILIVNIDKKILNLVSIKTICSIINSDVIITSLCLSINIFH